MKVTTRVVEDEMDEAESLYQAAAFVADEMRAIAGIGDALTLAGSVRKKVLKNGDEVYIPKIRYTLPDDGGAA